MVGKEEIGQRWQPQAFTQALGGYYVATQAYSPSKSPKGLPRSKAKRDSYLRYEEGRIRLEEYDMGWRMYLDRPIAMYFATLHSALTNRKIKEFLVLRGNDEEKAFVANLVKQIS